VLADSLSIAKMNRPALSNREKRHLVHGGDLVDVRRHVAFGIRLEELLD